MLRKLPANRLGCAAIIALMLLLPVPGYAAGTPVADVASATPVTQLVVRLRPEFRTAEGQAPGSAAVADLQRTLGQPVANVSVTPGGNQVIALVNGVDIAAAKKLVNALRMRGDVVWAEIQRGGGARAVMAKASAVTSVGSGPATVRQLIVTFTDPQATSAARNNAALGGDYDARLSSAAGMSLHVTRATIAGAWLVQLPNLVDLATAEAVAAKLESAGVVRFAAPDYRMRPAVNPNDPGYTSGDQWNLQAVATTGKFGIDATHAWDITTGSPATVIAVVDSGITSHPDLAGRFLPGYDFITDVTSANDGDGRDADPTDPGDWRTAGQCPGDLSGAEDSIWHGTMVTGVIAANSDNSMGVSGINWQANILPVRVIGRCGGNFSDILNGMAWAAGLSVPGVPANSHPAKVINVSLGGEGGCSNQIQALVDAILDTGTFIAVSAGNENRNADNFVPASCGGVSTVGATDQYGVRTSYSNFSTNMDISAPGGDAERNGPGDAIITTWNLGKTVALSPAYAQTEGTSFSSPEVAGVAALMLAVNPQLLPAQIKVLMAQSATPFPAGSPCAALGNCGAGIVNAFGAVKAAKASLNPGTTTVTVVEYYHSFLDHYFMTASASDIALLDGGAFPGWARTGESFPAYPAQAIASLSPVCRFFIPPEHGGSHFFSAVPSDCTYLLNAAANPVSNPNFSGYIEESTAAFYIALPFSAGVCAAGTVPVFRLWNQRVDSNHRYTTNPVIVSDMRARNYALEGPAPGFAAMCAPN